MSSDLALFRRLIDIGIALSVEKDTNKLMEIILLEAKDISNADGGTLYIRTKDDTLEFEIMHTDSLDVVQGGPAVWKSLSLRYRCILKMVRPITSRS